MKTHFLCTTGISLTQKQAVSNLENIVFGKGFQARVIPEVALCMVLACSAAGMVHRVSVTVWYVFLTGTRNVILIYKYWLLIHKHHATSKVLLTCNMAHWISAFFAPWLGCTTSIKWGSPAPLQLLLQYQAQRRKSKETGNLKSTAGYLSQTFSII